MNLFRKLKRGYRNFCVRRIIDREFRELFKFATRIEFLGEKVVNKINWDKEQIHFYSVNLLAQNLHKLKSIAILIGNGYSSDAWQIFRPLIEIAKEVKLQDIYSLGYKTANDYSHGNSNLIQPFVKGQDSRGLLLKAGATLEKREILIIFPSSLVLMFQMIMRANWYFKLGLNEEVKRLDGDITRYCNKIGKQGSFAD